MMFRWQNTDDAPKKRHPLQTRHQAYRMLPGSNLKGLRDLVMNRLIKHADHPHCYRGHGDMVTGMFSFMAYHIDVIMT